jgi:guanyl-specific ribonuclease Sa
MRRTLAFFVLLAVAVISIGCASSDQRGTTTNANATGTTTYSNSSVPAATPAQSDSAPTGGAVPSAAPPKASPTEPKIKPPTEE